MKQSTFGWAGAFFALVALTGCSAKSGHQKTPDTINVTVQNIGQLTENTGTQIVYNGTLQADQVIDLSFQVSGTINSFPVQSGDYVKKGELIATVEETTYRSQYNAQMAQARLAEENYKRILDVFQKGSAAEIKMIEARSNFEQASAASRATYQNIAHTRLYAPQSGYIGEKKTEAGAIASPGQPVAQLLDTRSIEVLVAVPENEVNRYHRGDQAVVKVDALGDQPLQGHVSEIGVLAVNNSANYNVKVKLLNSRQQLRPGMLCKVVFNNTGAKTSSVDDAGQLVVPAQAVQVDEKGHNYVFVVSADNKAVRKEVTTGSVYNNGLAITKGLTTQDRLILSGFQKLTDQTPVKITR